MVTRRPLRDLTLVDDPPDLELPRRPPGGSGFTPGVDPPDDEQRRPAAPPPVLCFPLELPPFEQVAATTRRCFWAAFGAELTDWPPTDCPTPCVGRALCDPPSPLAAAMPVAVLERELLAAGWTPLPGDQAHPSELTFVDAALALLAEHADLVEWAVCTATAWAPQVEYPQPIRDCLADALAGGMTVYLVGTFPPNRGGGIPTGGATDLLTAEPAWGPGVVIPIRHPYWGDALDAFQGGGTNGLCATAALAQTILHEILHLCGTGLRALPKQWPELVWQAGLDPEGYLGLTQDDDNRAGLADDDDDCWVIQNQAATPRSGWS